MSASTTFAIHEVADIFPPMSVDDFRALKEDIREHGQREPITLWDNEVIDGRHVTPIEVYRAEKRRAAHRIQARQLRDMREAKRLYTLLLEAQSVKRGRPRKVAA